MTDAKRMVHQTVDDIHRARRIAHGIRKRALGLTIKQNGCYLSQALSSAEILAALYTCVLNIGPSLASMKPGPFPGVPAPGQHDLGADYNGPRTGGYDRLLLSAATMRLRYTRRWSRSGAWTPRRSSSSTRTVAR